MNHFESHNHPQLEPVLSQFLSTSQKETPLTLPNLAKAHGVGL